MHDLACYVDSCLRYDDAGNIVGRNGGIRAWIAENVPELSPRYKTIMRYKALAMRVRQLAGIKDPMPTSSLLDGPADGTEKQERNLEVGGKNYYAQDSHYTHEWDMQKRKRGGLEQKQERLRRMLTECRNTFKDVFDRIDSELGQDKRESELG